MKLILAAFVLLTFATRGSAQSLPALHDALKKPSSDSLKIVAYQSMVNHFRFSDIDSALHYSKQGIAFAREKNYPFGEALMTFTMGQVNERHGFLGQATTQYLEAKAIFQELGFRKGVAGTINGLGVVAGRRGKFDEATRFFLEALSIFEEIKSVEGIVQTYIKLGVVSDHMGDLDQALEYYLDAEKLNAELPFSNASLTLLNNIGIVYGKRGDLATAIKYFHRGLRESDPERSTGIHILLLGSLGLAYEKSGMPDSARYFQERALTMARENNLPEEEARSLVNLSTLIRKTDPSESLDLLRQALEITQRIQQLSLMSEVYESMIGLYKERNEYKVAMELAEKRQLLRDSMFSIEKSREIASLHATQELARQENEIRNLGLKNETSTFQRNVMFAVAIIAVVVIGIVWFYNARISRLNTKLIRKQNQLKSSNNIKDKLFSILGHDLRAPLNQVIGLLNLLAIKHRGEEESPIIEKLRQQSKHTLETLDNLLMWGQSQLKGVRLNQQTLRVKDQVAKSIFLLGDYAVQKNVRLVETISSELSIHADASHFDFVIRNLVSNAIKFSHAGGTVNINATPSTGKKVVFSVSDSGVGIPQNLQKKIFSAGNESARGTWNEKGTGIGLMLCREYIAENGGRLWLESKEGKGSTFYFSLQARIASPQNVPARETA